MFRMPFAALCIVLLITGCAARTPPAAPPPAAQAAATAPDNATPTPDQLWDVNAVTCEQWTEASDDDRAAVGMFYYGWLAGTHGIHSLRPINIQPNLRKVLDYCTKNPQTTIVRAFRATLGAQKSS